MFALILTLCSFASCNGYIIAIDTEWHKQEPCQETLFVESDLFGKAFTFDVESGKLKALNATLAQKYLDRFNIKEDMSTLSDYDFTCEKIADHDMP